MKVTLQSESRLYNQSYNHNGWKSETHLQGTCIEGKVSSSTRTMNFSSLLLFIVKFNINVITISMNEHLFVLIVNVMNKNCIDLFIFNLVFYMILLNLVSIGWL